ncbi:Phosphatidylinositol N-acetylglucosaminyltransferase GPI2 subunit [Candida viswanathii]|uniref:Phosphatidylinositol N-acetylglucosaminyltransferase GPI2 subunit n=1 Tax=Candida viswanathii TaxID=5486 RepID=A0A367Y0S8_9ASCO|nr:Phosphatidylinositol N-acetylglucosaminyltransferase GPI2 subunit [Candida viswanathii]
MDSDSQGGIPAPYQQEQLYGAPSSPLPPWKKLLYLKQPYPDNYTDKSFLSQLKKNKPLSKYTYRKLVEDFSLIPFYMSCILQVILLFVGIHVEQWDPIVPTLVITTLSFVAFLFNKNAAMNMKSLMVITFILLILSPILKSLSKSTSSDSIWAISFMLCLANAIFHEYSLQMSYRPILSTNISLSNAIVLASRLNSTLEAFAFVLFAVEVNILLPLYDVRIRQLGYDRLHWALMLTVVLFVTSTFYMLDFIVYIVYYYVMCTFITLVLPLVYMYL